MNTNARLNAYTGSLNDEDLAVVMSRLKTAHAALDRALDYNSREQIGMVPAAMSVAVKEIELALFIAEAALKDRLIEALSAREGEQDPRR